MLVLVLLSVSVIYIVSTPAQTDTKQNSSLPEPEPEELTCERVYVPPEPTFTSTYNVPLDLELQELVENLCINFDFHPLTIYGMMYVESRFQNITSDDVHIGMMQINREYFPFFVEQSEEIQALPEFERNPWNPKANIIAGIYALGIWRAECAKYGYYDERDWLETYNRGYTYFSMDKAQCTYADKVYAAQEQWT